MDSFVMFGRAALCAVGLAILASAPLDAAVISFDAPFSTEGQSMWGEGEAFELDFDQRLFDPITWGSRAQPLPFGTSNVENFSVGGQTITNPRWTAWEVQRRAHENSCVTVLGGTHCAVPDPGPAPQKTITTPAVEGEFGVSAQGSTSGSFALDFSAEFSGGTVAADMPLQVDFQIDETELAPGTSFTLKSDYFVESQALLETESPNAEAVLDLALDLFTESTASACLGAANCEGFEFIPDIDVDGSFEILGIDEDGVRFFGVPKDDLAESAIGAVADIATSKRSDEEKADLQEIIDTQTIREQTLNNEIKGSDQNITARQKEIASLDRQVASKEEEIDNIDKSISDAEDAESRADDQIASNNTRIDEIDNTLSDSDSGLSQDERNRLASERSGLVTRNDRLSRRKTALQSQQDDLKNNDRPAAVAQRDALDNDRNLKRSQVDTLKDDKRRKKADRDDARKKKKDARFKRNSDSLLSKIPRIGDLIDVDLSLPVVETAGDLDFESDTPTLVSQGEDQFLEMLLGVDDALVLATKSGITAASAGAGSFVFLIPPLSSEVELTDLLRAEYSIFDLNVGPRLFATQDFEFAPEFEVVLETGFGDPIVFDLGDTLEIPFPADATELTLEPTIRLKNTENFSGSTGLRVQPIAELAVLGAIAGVDPPQSIKNLGIGTKEISLGPLVGSIDGIDLVPVEHEFERLDFGFDVFKRDFSLGGFDPVKGSTISVAPNPAVPLTGGGFASLDAWNTFGDVSLIEHPDEAGNNAARLEAASPVSVSTTLDTPSTPFSVVFDYRFDPSEGDLGVFLDSRLIDRIDATLAAEFLTWRTFVDDPALLGLEDASLVFEFFGTTGSVLLLDNIRISNVAQLDVTPAPTASVPEPQAWTIFALGLAVLGAAAGRQKLRGSPATDRLQR